MMKHWSSKEGYQWLSRTVLVTVLWLLVACEKQVVFHQSVPISDTQWNRLDTICFTPQVPDSGTVYQTYLEVRLLQSYPYLNLVIGYEYLSPENELLLSDTYELHTTDSYYDKNGSGLAGIYSYSGRLKSLPIEKAGNYTIRFFQLGNDSLLKGVQDVGVKLSRH